MRHVRGFTLIEIAVVLVIMGIMAAAALRIATSLISSSANRDTRQKASVIKDTLVNYLRVNNRLPCPDTKAGFLTSGAISFSLAAPPDGIENRKQASGTFPDPSLACDLQFGVLPYATLGLSAETATDGFGNLFSYSLSSGYGWSNSVVGTAPNQASMQGNIQVIDKDANGNSSPPRMAAVVVLSYGPNGFGAYTPKGTTISAPPGTNTDELINVAGNIAGVPTFINRSVTDDSTALGGAFDDFVMALSANDLVGGLVAQNSQQSLNSKVSTAKQDIAAIEAAIQAFVVQNGRYPRADYDGTGPCASGTALDGLEDATCYRGNVPWKTLGVVSLDPWGAAYKYAVSPALATNSIGATTFFSVDFSNIYAGNSVTFNTTTPGALSGMGLALTQVIYINAAVWNGANYVPTNMGLQGSIISLSNSSVRITIQNVIGTNGTFSNWLLTAKAFPATVWFQESHSSAASQVPFVVYSLGQNNANFFANATGAGAPCTSSAPASPVPPVAPACLGLYENNSHDGSSSANAFVRDPIVVPPGITNPTLYFDDIIDYVPKIVIDGKML